MEPIHICKRGGEPKPQYAELRHRVMSLVERYQAQTALLDSESEFRTLFENNPDTVVLINFEGKILNCNDAATKMLHKGKAEIIGATISDLAIFSPDDITQFQYSMMQRAKGESGSPIVSQIRLKGGELKWVEGQATAVLKEGRCDAFQIIAKDITERKVSEIQMGRLNRELVAIKECNRSLVKAQTEQDLLDGVCHIVCDEAGYRLAWIGYGRK